MVYDFEQYNESTLLKGHLKLGNPSNGTDTITVNSRYFEKNGVPFIGVMGEIHFSRIKRSEWRDRLEKMKAGGVNIVATYIFWIYHEETEGNYDFSGDLDLRAFILEAREVGLDVIIRIGPWAHGECRHGGFPDWLLAKGLKLRSNEPEYLAYATDWYRHIFNEVKGLFFKDGGNIIGIQFENELVNAPEHLLKLKEIALSMGFEAPIYTATGWNSKFGARIPVDEFIPVFAAYADAPWAKGIDRRPPSPHFCFDNRRNDSLVGNDVISEEMTDADGWRLPYERYPFALCELGSGVQSTYQRRTVISDLDAYAVALVKLGCGNNLMGYYMYAGGSNKIGRLSTFQETRSTGSPNDYPVINYDFHTAITEYGEVNPRYGMLNILHLFAGDFGNILAPMENVSAKMPVLEPSNCDELRYTLRTDGRSGFVFVNNHQRYAKLKEHENVSFAALNVTIPEMTVKSDAAFVLPVNLMLSTLKLEYAVAQPVCRLGNLFFFLKIDGNDAVFKFENMNSLSVPEFDYDAPGMNIVPVDGGIRLCVLPFEKAVYLRKLFGKVCLGNGCNLFEKGESISAVEQGSFSYLEFADDGNETSVLRKTVNNTGNPENAVSKNTESATSAENTSFSFFSDEATPIPAAKLSGLLDHPDSVKKEIIEELHVSDDEYLTLKPVHFADDGFATIDECFDVALVISEGKLVADKFYDRLPFRFPKKCTLGDNTILVMSRLKNNVFIDELFD